MIIMKIALQTTALPHHMLMVYNYDTYINCFIQWFQITVLSKMKTGKNKKIKIP